MKLHPIATASTACAAVALVAVLVGPSLPLRADDDRPRAVALSTEVDPIDTARDRIDAADHRIDILAYKIEVPGVRKALERAVDRGVEVRLVADADEARGKQSQVEKIDRAGARVRLWKPGKMHAKLIIIDGERVLTGSFNLSRSAGKKNVELLLELDDPRTVAEATAAFKRAWKAAKLD